MRGFFSEHSDILTLLILLYLGVLSPRSHMRQLTTASRSGTTISTWRVRYRPAAPTSGGKWTWWKRYLHAFGLALLSKGR